MPACTGWQRPTAPRRPPNTTWTGLLARYKRVPDIGRDESRALIEDTQLQGCQRRLADLRCGDAMSRQLITITQSDVVAALSRNVSRPASPADGGRAPPSP